MHVTGPGGWCVCWLGGRCDSGPWWGERRWGVARRENGRFNAVGSEIGGCFVVVLGITLGDEVGGAIVIFVISGVSFSGSSSSWAWCRA